MRFASLAVVVFAGLILTGRPAEAQLWKPTKKPVATTAAPTRPAAAKPARKKVRRAARPTRPARPAARPVARDDAPRARAGGDDGMPEFDNAPRIVVERPGRGER